MRKKTLTAIVITSCVAVGLLVARVGKKEILPEELNKVDNPVAIEYLLAAKSQEEYGKFSSYRKAIDAVADPNLKSVISNYASGDLFSYAQSRGPSVTQIFRVLEFALMFEPDQEDKDRIIESSMSTVDSYSQINDYRGAIARYLITCANYTSDPNKQEEFKNHAAAIYQLLANSAESHLERSNHLEWIQKLKQPAN